MYIKKSLSKAIGLTKPTKPTIYFLQLAIFLFFAAQNIYGQSDSLLQLRFEARVAYNEMLDAINTATGSQREQLLQQFDSIRNHYRQRFSEMDTNPPVSFAAGRTQTTTPTRSGFDWYVSASGSDGNQGTTESSPFLTIQKAIDVASNGDRIKVADGRYMENISIYFSDIELIGNPNDPASVIIEGGSNYNAVVHVWGGAGLLSGFTITGNNTQAIEGGCNTIFSNLIIKGCDNSGSNYFFLIYFWDGTNAIIQNTLMYGNHTECIFGTEGNIQIINSTIVDNSVQFNTIHFQTTMNSTIKNCIIRNPGCNYELSGDMRLELSYCNILGGTSKIIATAASEISDNDPQFVDPTTGKYQLSPTSVYCIDAGDPDPVWNDVNFPPSYGGVRNDLGAYGGPSAFAQSYQFVAPDSPVIPDVSGADPNSFLLLKNDTTKLAIIGSDAVISGENPDNTGMYVYGPNNLEFWTDGFKRLTITGAGNVGIGTDSPGYKLDVRGSIRADEVLVNSTGADFVFAPDYRLRPLTEVEQFIADNQRLPEIAPADSMMLNGVNMGELQMMLLQKIEELTLYVIEQQKQIEDLKQKLKAIRTKNEE